MSRIYTDLAVLHLTGGRILVTETFGTTLVDLRTCLDVPLTAAPMNNYPG